MGRDWNKEQESSLDSPVPGDGGTQNVMREKLRDLVDKG